jgi:hypothetical protein
VLSSILGDINASLASLFAAANPNATPPIQILIGSEWLEGQDAANRVIWVPARDRYDGPRKQTSAQTLDPSVTAGGIPRSLRTRWMGLECHIWGAPPSVADPTGATYFDSVDDMLRWVEIAIHENVHGDYHLLGGEYPKKQQASGFTTYGRSYVLYLEIETPLEDQDVETVEVTSLPVTGTIAPSLPPPQPRVPSAP